MAQVVEDLHPELRALGLLKPHPEHLALTVHGDRQRQVAGLALHRPAVADLEHERVKEQDRVKVIQRPLLPGLDVLEDRVGDPADQIPSDRHPVELAQVSLDIAGRQAPRIQRQDLLVKPLKAPLALSHQLRLKAPIPIPRRADLDRLMVRQQRLGLVLDLQRRVVEPEALAQHPLQARATVVAVVVPPDDDVSAQAREPGRDLPDVEVVHGDDARVRRKRMTDGH